MKTLRHHPPFDYCLESLEFLQQRLKSFFKGQPFWIPDHPGQFYQNMGSERPLNIVLLGGFYKRFFESPYWPEGPYRLWCVSRSVQMAMENLFFIPQKTIGVIEREALCPRSTKMSTYDFSDPFTFVVSGRLSSVKNLEGAIHFAHSLQQDHSLPAKLLMIGQFDRMKHEHLGRRAFFDYQTKLTDLIHSLDWKERPIILPKMEQDKWPLAPHPQKLLLSFSTYLSEDFNVSLAQAQALGWGGLVTEWGGHLEAQGENLFKFSSSFAPESFSPYEFQRGQAHGLAEAFAKKQIKANGLIHKPHNQLARLVESEEVAQWRDKSIHHWGRDILSILRDEHDYFADTSSGGEFFWRYQECFRQEDTLPLHLVFVPHETSDEVMANERLYELGRKQFERQERICFVPTTDLKYRDTWLKIKQAQKFTLLVEGKAKLKAYLEEMLGESLED